MPSNIAWASKDSQQPTPANEGLGKAYLSFDLSLNLHESIPGVFAMDDVHEVLVVSPEKLTPLFNMPACVIGLLTRRSRILWAVDLSHLLLSWPITANETNHPDKYSIVITRLSPEKNRTLLGLVVKNVKGHIQLDPATIEPATKDLLPELYLYLQGTVLQGTVQQQGIQQQNSRLAVMDVEAIANALTRQIMPPLPRPVVSNSS